MSVVVRMEIPTSCEKCPACDYEEGNCLLADDRNTLPHNGKRRSWCPIICQLPEGHGRLGDLDELAAGCDAPYWCRWLSEIEDAPTIVPAEAERSET